MCRINFSHLQVQLFSNFNETLRLWQSFSGAKRNDNKSAQRDLAKFASLAWQSAISTGQGLTTVATRDILFIIPPRAPSAVGRFFYFAISLSFRWTDLPTQPAGRTWTRSLCQFSGIIGSRRSCPARVTQEYRR